MIGEGGGSVLPFQTRTQVQRQTVHCHVGCLREIAATGCDVVKVGKEDQIPGLFLDKVGRIRIAHQKPSFDLQQVEFY